MSDCAFVVFARAPVAGQVKTRLFRADPDVTRHALGRLLDAQDAAALHLAFVADVLRKGQRCGFEKRVLYAAEGQEHPALLRLAQEFGYRRRAQSGTDLGARMAAAIAEQLADPLADLVADPVAGPGAADCAGDRRVPSAVVLVGTDSPTLPLGYLRQAARALQAGVDVVLGPATDGGYYLIGMRSPQPSLFPADMPWGSEQVLPRTLEQLRELSARGLRCHLLPFFYDCDTPADLRLLRDHLALVPPMTEPSSDDDIDSSAPATQAALRQLALL